MKTTTRIYHWVPLHPFVKALAIYARKIPAPPSKIRILKILSRCLPSNAWVYREGSSGTLFCADPSDFIGWNILTKGAFEPHSINLCRDLLRHHKGWFADIGAHHGLFSCVMSSIPELKILCFEPNPASFLQLHDNINRNQVSDAHLVHAALGDKAGLIPWCHGGLAEGMTAWSHGVLDHEKPDYWIPAVVFREVVHEFGLGAPTVVKLDVEGSELSALEGFDFENLRPSFILMEAEPFWAEKLAFMKDREFTAFGADMRVLTESDTSAAFIEGNALFASGKSDFEKALFGASV